MAEVIVSVEIRNLASHGDEEEEDDDIDVGDGELLISGAPRLRVTYQLPFDFERP